MVSIFYSFSKYANSQFGSKTQNISETKKNRKIQNSKHEWNKEEQEEEKGDGSRCELGEDHEEEADGSMCELSEEYEEEADGCTCEPWVMRRTQKTKQIVVGANHEKNTKRRPMITSVKQKKNVKRKAMALSINRDKTMNRRAMAAGLGFRQSTLTFFWTNCFELLGLGSLKKWTCV